MRAFAFATLAAATLFASSANAASPAAGSWKTPEEGGRVDVRDCEGGICGYVMDGARLRENPAVTDQQNRDAAMRGRPLKGLALFEGMSGGPKTWRGKVYNPVDGGTYSGTVTLISPDQLKLTGCIIFPLCKTQVWLRMK